MYNINYAMFIIYIVLFINVIECYSDKKTIHSFRNNLPPPPPPQKKQKRNTFRSARDNHNNAN